jgi:hypothetical protein
MTTTHKARRKTMTTTIRLRPAENWTDASTARPSGPPRLDVDVLFLKDVADLVDLGYTREEAIARAPTTSAATGGRSGWRTSKGGWRGSSTSRRQGAPPQRQGRRKRERRP